MANSTDLALHRQHAHRLKGQRFLRNVAWKAAHPGGRTLLYGPAVFENPYQTLIYSAFPARVSVGTTGRAATYRKARIAGAYHMHWDEFGLSAGADGRPAYCAGLDAFLEAGGRLFWTVHNADPHDGLAADKQALFHEGRRYLSERAAAIHVHSDVARDLICARYNADPARVHVIPHPSYLGWYGDVARDRLKDGPSRFLAFGAFRDNKGLDLILAGLRGVATSVPLGDVHIAGRGASAAGEDPVPGRAVRVTDGFIPDADLPGLFGAADFSIFGFSSILTSGSLMLALGFGAVPVAPDLPTLRDALPEALHPLLYRPGDAEDLTRVLEQASDMPATHHAHLRAAAFAHAEDLRPERVSKRLYEVFDQAW
ncbi:MAG: glycosyltransferase family 4 protein [Paracoccaceae bacterium]